MQTRHRVIPGPAANTDLPPESVDLVVTSPPYPMIEMWDQSFSGQGAGVASHLERGEGPAAFEAMHRVLDEAWGECHRVLRPGGFACINIGDATRSIAGEFRLYTNHARIVVACEALGFQSLPAVIWRKQTNAPNKFMGSGMLPSGAYVTLEHEYILILRKGGKRVFAPAERERRSKSAFFWEERNSWFSDLWDFKGVQQRLGSNEARARSGAFPFELGFRLICMYSMQGDLVLDPFLGTGTTSAAALACARDSIGVEADTGLLPVIEGTIEAGVTLGNERQLARLRAHDEFVRRYEADKGRPPGHTNTTYGFPVVTRQEIDLVLPRVTAMRLGAEREWVADHETLHDHGEPQLDLF